MPPLTWQVSADRVLTLDRPVLVGVLNVTPDSFSDGGSFGSVEAAVDHALALVEQGASVVDVGGESTRPGASRVTAAEQIDRTVPVIEGIRARCDVLVSIDTTLGAVAAAALEAGAAIVNDVAAGTEDPGLLDLVARHGGGVVLMHRLRRPEDDDYSDRHARPPSYGDVVAEVRDFLVRRARVAETRGVAPSSIVIDPGLGFGKTVEQNFEIIRRTPELVAAGYPVLSAASRKSFLGAAAGEPVPGRRVAGSTAVSVAHWLAGVRLFRVHDVAAHRQALDVACAVAPPAPPVTV